MAEYNDRLKMTDNEIVEAIDIQTGNNDKHRNKLIERYNKFINEYKKFQEDEEYSLRTFGEACYSALERAKVLDEKNQTGEYFQSLFYTWYQDFGLGNIHEGKHGLWVTKIERLLEKGHIIMGNIVDGDNDDVGEYFRPPIFSPDDLDKMNNLEVGFGYLKENDLKGLEYIFQTIQEIQFPRMTAEEFETMDEFEWLRIRHKTFERYYDYLNEYDFSALSYWRRALEPEFDYTYWDSRKVTDLEDMWLLTVSVGDIIEAIENALQHEFIALENIKEIYDWLKDYEERKQAVNDFENWLSAKGYAF